MRHDAKEISCDPTMHIMSPKLGSGKVTWSKCSRTYLEDFLMYVEWNTIVPLVSLILVILID